MRGLRRRLLCLGMVLVLALGLSLVTGQPASADRWCFRIGFGPPTYTQLSPVVVERCVPAP